MTSAHKKPVGIRTLASKLQLSVGTVSRALNDEAGVHHSTRRRVLEAAREFGYVPNVQARSFKTGKTHQIGVVVPTLRDPVYIEKVRNAHDAAWEAGYQLSFATSEWKPEYEEAVCLQLLGRGVDGLIVLNPATDSIQGAHYRGFLERGKPVLLVLAESPHQNWTKAEPAAMNASFAIIEVAIAESLVEALTCLAELGHRRLGLLGYRPEHNLSHRHRINAVLPLFERPKFKGIALDTIESDADTVEAGYQAMRRYLERTEPARRATGFQALNDYIALGGIRALKDAGYDVPGHASMIGFSGIEPASYTIPRLTTISQLHLDLGRRAVQIILDLLAGTLVGPFHESLKAKLIMRESTGPPPASP